MKISLFAAKEVLWLSDFALIADYYIRPCYFLSSDYQWHLATGFQFSSLQVLFPNDSHTTESVH